MHIAIQFFVLLVFSVVLLSLIRSKWIAKIVAILLAAFYVLELSSVYMGGSLIDYKYYIHTGATDVELMFGFFLKETLMAAVAWLFFFWMFYYLSRKMSVWSSKKMLSLPLLFGSIALMCLPKGVLHQLNEVRQLVYVEAHSMVEACKSLGLPVDKFVYEEEHSKAVKGKNIIVISLESLEQGLLREPFEELSPHLRKLSEKYTYYDMHQNPGSDWTAASLYTALTGFPAYFRSKPNEIFLDVEELKGNNVGKVLNSAGYDLTYLMGKKEFAGTEDMLRTFHFEVLSEKDFPGKYPYCEWGLHDKDLFAEAKNIVRQKQQDDKPFALFLSTIGTHLPNGIYDKRMEAFISPKKSSLEFMVAAVDYLLGDFIGFLEKNGYLENTVFYIYPDHLIMGNTPSVLQDFGTLRDLYLITNASSEKLPYPSTQKIWQVNIPKVILDGAEVQHRMPFFCDYIPEEERVYDFINKHKKEIVAFNEAAIRTVRFDEGIDIYLKGEKGFLIKNDKGSTEHFELQPQKGNALLLSIDQRGRIMDNKTVEDFYFFHTKRYHSQEIQLFIQRKTDGLYACLRKGDKLAVAKMGEEHISFDKSDFEVLRKWSFDDAAYRLPPSPNYHQPYDFIEITSGKGGKAEINLPGQIIIGTQSFPLQKGINLLRCEGDECEVQHFAITEKAALPPQFLSAIKDLKQKRQFFAVVTQEWSADWSVYQKDLEAVGLPALSRIKPKQCYVAYAYKGYITEMKQWTPLSLRLPLHPRKPLRSMREIDADAYNAQKLIAHAGGAIDGITYTNSLDALQRNYAKGFRLFELDIIKTTDGHYVAAHDWNYWAKHCGRSDRKLVDKATFLQHKIDGAYSLLDMERINAWFSAHPDAILITDKVNEPKDFADRFVDKSRLMMELFSVEAVEEAIREGIKVIPSEKVLSEIKGDKIEWLQKRGIGQVALSRLKFREQLPFIKDLKAAGIKVYLYHVNAEKGKDESYVLLHEMDYAWGMYVDFTEGANLFLDSLRPFF